MPERLVVIGADAAGMSCASQARRRRDQDDLEIVSFDRGNYTSFSACGIPYLIGGVVDSLDELVVRPVEEHRRRGIDVHLRHEVTEIDLDRRRVVVRDLEDDSPRTEDFDLLMVATGAVPVRPNLPGADAGGIFGVQTLDDARRVLEALSARSPRRAVIVGGGYIGIEMAEAMLARGMGVTLVEQAAAPMSTLDPDMGTLVSDAMRAFGIDVRTEDAVEEFESDDGWVSGVVTASARLPVDVVILGIGVCPNVSVAEAAGIPLGHSGAIAVDRRMRTKIDGVWAAGDCAEKFHRVSREGVAIPLGTHANKEGRVAGIDIGGGYETFPGVVGTAVSKVCDLEVARTGLKEAECRASGFDYVAATVDSKTRAGYFPGAADIKTKLIVERRTGRLLGGQIIGREDAAKRIDALAVALWNGMSVDKMYQMDLGYAPPFAPVWDPVLVAARRAWEEVSRRP
jgi:NADPH-dependent 2,4-dienoyl-CoA reductase/sulfur reductase-like enzyme